MSTSKLLAAAVCSLAALAVGATGQSAAAAVAVADGAVVYHGGPCSFSSPGFPIVTATEVHSVITPSGNASLSCHGQLPPGEEPSTTVRVDVAGRCRIGLPGGGVVVATQGHILYTRSGHASLLCQYKDED